MKKVSGFGPKQADIVIVGEAPGDEEEQAGVPFVGASGHLLNTLLREAGIDRDACYITNVVKYRPPGNDMSAWLTEKKKLGVANEWPERHGRYFSPEVEEGLADIYTEVAERKPKVIVGLGNTALWAFTGEWGITNWRGSELIIGTDDAETLWGAHFVPSIHPASVLRSWSTRPFLLHDLKARVVRRLRSGFPVPQWEFNYAPEFQEVVDFLSLLPDNFSVDVETSRGQIVCIGIGVSPTKAMCIPFIGENYAPYWEGWQRAEIVSMLKRVLPRGTNVGQNYNYDMSYLDDNWGITIPFFDDTKIAQNVLFPGTPAALGHLSSMHCDWHCYWKEDARDWQNLRDFDRLYRYNCRDCCATYEIFQKQHKMLEAAKLVPQYEDRLHYAGYVFRMQQRGVIRDEQETKRITAEVDEALASRALTVADKAGRAINITSWKQINTLMYKDLACRKPLKSKGGTDEEALTQVAKWHPEHADLCTAIIEYRSLDSMKSNFLQAKLDPDGMLRTSYSTCGTETMRLTSGNNNFNRGCNLLNISGSGTTHSGTKVPNFRRAIVPPSGHTFFDCDLQRADVWVVAWDSGDAYLKAKLASDDIHMENAKELFGVQQATKQQREFAKTFVHATDYGGKARTIAIQCGCTVHEADMAQKRWFSIHPGILEWHKRTEQELKRSRMVVNAFGYRRIYFDRVDDAMVREALAWKPQSTVALVASQVHMRMELDAEVDVLIQMYDSVAGVYPTVDESIILPKLYEATKIVVPYDDPLIIPMGIKTSRVSWGDCAERGADHADGPIQWN